ncbi:hypothetical protein ACMT1E_04485 [Sphingomonas flavalba]|uniref:hypothetical protein n=1 Tax=Sphingomonas flavalba TaxID=2559804 RepID=UPI0039DF3E63
MSDDLDREARVLLNTTVGARYGVDDRITPTSSAIRAISTALTRAHKAEAEVERLREANGQAIMLIDEINLRASSRQFYGINQPLSSKLATVRATLARAVIAKAKERP